VFQRSRVFNWRVQGDETLTQRDGGRMIRGQRIKHAIIILAGQGAEMRFLV
jgi:hypothetical protein